DLAASSKHLGQSTRPERDAPQVRRPFTDRAGNLGRPSADVDAKSAGAGGSSVQNAEADKPCLFSAGHDLQVQARFGARSLDDLFPILCLAHGAGGDRANARVESPAAVAVAAQGGEQAVGDVPRNPASFEHTLAGSNGIPLFV